MSHDANKWEADIRRVVETHEFDYDPRAWAAMEGLLDGAAGGKAADGGSAGLFWKVIIPLLLGLGCLLAWWYWTSSEAVSPPPVREEVAPPPDMRPGIETPPAPPEERSSLRPEAPSTLYEREEWTPLPLLPGRDVRLSPPPISLPVVRAPFPAVAPLSDRPIPLLSSPEPPKLGLKPVLPEPEKRRRNRKTLYPDVIEKY